MRRKSALRGSLLAAGVLGLSWLTPLGVLPAHAASVITVTTTADGVNESDGKCSLVEAIYAANFDDNVAIKTANPETLVTTECAAGIGVLDTIQLPAGAVFSPSTVIGDLDNPFGPTATPIVTSTIIIEGNGARIERSGTTPMRAFAVDSSAGLVLEHVHIKGFFVHGGDGGQLGGGGGLGAGGAIYVREGTVVVEDSTFEDNRAEGGNGGNAVNALNSQGASFSTDGGGGGGGLAGTGGTGAAFAGFADCPDCNGFGGGAGGGGGGARGTGGSAAPHQLAGQFNGGTFGGGGGGTLTDGQDSPRGFGDLSGSGGGTACGGDGGIGADGDSGCDGGGGGGGPAGGGGGTGGYGGGGGGGGYILSATDGASADDGGHGGFGGGGGAGGRGANGGDAGFGAGGGGGHSSGGEGGTFGGHGGHDNGGLGIAVTAAGGGGAGLGGAIFSDYGTVISRNSTFTGNSVSHGFAGDDRGFSDGATNGSDAGAAIFAVDGAVTVNNSTISGNQSTGDAAGIAMYRSSRSDHSASLTLTNTIVAANSPTTSECHLFGSVSSSGTNNLFGGNLNCPSASSTSGDPGLSPLAIEAPGNTPTMAIDDTSPAYDAGDDDTCEPADQRGVSRPRSLHCDIGAYEYVKPSADLAVATTPVDSTVAGADLQYVVQVHNNGPTAAENVAVVDTIPAGTTFVSITGSGGLGCTGTGPVTCTTPLMHEGTTALLTLTVHVPPATSAGTSLTNGVTVSSTTPDPVPENNTATASSTVSTRADLSVVKSGPASPVAGADATYRITVANAGPSTARTVALGDPIAAGTTFRSLGAPAGWTCSTPAVGTPGPAPVSCTTASMSPATSAAFTLVVRVGASAADESELCNTASVTAATTDPSAGNNSSEACGDVRTVADLQVAGTASTTGKAGRGTAVFAVTVTNNGPSDSRNVALAATSDLFTGPAPTTSATAGATCSVAGAMVSCLWASIAPGGSVQVTITVPWRSAVGSICQTATVTSGTSDPNAANNTGAMCVGKKKK